MGEVPVLGTTRNSSIVAPMYSTGEYYHRSGGWKDAEYKIRVFRDLFARYARAQLPHIQTVADVGCGNGEITCHLQATLEEMGYSVEVTGYDVHPAVARLRPIGKVRFVEGDFCQLATGIVDLVTLFDVIEHIPDPITFLRSVAAKSRYVALHIPLDHSILNGVRDMARANLKHPGHLLILDMPSTLNFLCYCGLRVDDYAHSPVFRAPSGQETRLQKIVNPIREVLFRLSPYFLHKTLGGVSLMVLARTPRQLKDSTS